MAKKEYIGLIYEETRLRVARLRVRKNGLELIEVDTVDLPYPITSIPDTSVGDLDFSEDYEDIFEVESSQKESSEDDLSFEDFEDLAAEPSQEESESPGLEDSFDMTKTESEEEAAKDNEQLIADYLSQYSARKLRIGTHIPFGRTTFQVLTNVNAGSMKKNERHEFFLEKLQPVYDREISPDQYAWVQIDDNTCLLAYSSDEYTFINLIELSETYLKKKVLIQERLPDEGIWAGLARVNYDLKEDDITGLIAIGPSASRIIFMKGGQIVNVLPIITEGESSDNILNTIFSKILFEIDKGDLPRITRLLLVRSAKISEKARKYFDKQFEDVEVDFLTPKEEHLSYADEILNSPAYLQPYMTAIGAGWAASKVHDKEFSDFSLLPEYIREKQRVLKLEWHGILILILIALTPLFLNSLYQTRSDELTGLQQNIRLLESQIEELQPVATMTEDLMGEITLIQSENDRLVELALYSQQWSQVNQILNEGVSGISNLWLTSLNTADENSVVFEGYSLTRAQVPDFASLFTYGNIQGISQTEVRGQTVYNFTLRANNIQQDVVPFLMEMPQRDYDAERGDEIEIHFSSSENAEAGRETQPPAAVQNRSGSANTGNSASSAETSAANTNRDTRSTESEAGQSGVSPAESTEEEQPANRSEVISSPVAATESNSSYGLMGPEDELMSGAYTIVLHSIRNGERAEREVIALKGEGYKATLWDIVLADNQTWWRIGVGQFRTVSEALEAIQQLPDQYRERNFIIRIHEGQ